MDEKRNFKNDDHALMTGIVIGTLIKAGIDAYMGVDEDGSYIPVINLPIDYGETAQRVVQVWVVGE